tara:strand:+ start:638 stop:1855 length:1218 start_codon:yes stop_codon:yes gene_type:complete
MKIYKNIICCRICKSKKLKEVLDLNNQPTANQLTKNFYEKEHKIPLKLLFCEKCKTLQLSSTVNSNYLFSKYVWVTNTSKVAREYCKLFVKRTNNITKKKINYVCEIASNDGTLLKEYKNIGYEILGVDPAKNISNEANKNNIKTLNGFFDYKLSNYIKNKFGKSDLIIARNVIPHVENIHSVIKGIKNLLSKNGTVAIEFHYLDKIINGLQYDSVYHEHIYYFSLKSISHLFSLYGLHLFDFDKSPISGGSLVIYLSHLKRKKTIKLSKLIKLENRKALNSYYRLKKFGLDCIKHKKDLIKIIDNLDGKICGYGASARSSTLLNFSQIDYKKINFIIDKNPMKKGYFTPGTKIKIIPFRKNKLKNIQNVLLLAWNFKNEIINEFKLKKIKCKFILPLPNKIKIL